MLKIRGFARIAAIAAAVFMLVVATPQAAVAAVDNIWAVWVREVTNRSKVEVPFVILTSLPAMLISTPFWFGLWSVDKIKSAGDSEDDE